jgi:GNAT superfamily N-acetyltransferase
VNAVTAGKEVRLRDGTRVLIRPMDTGDRELVRAGFERLSPESRYRRFLTPMPTLTDRQLAYLTDVDHHDHEAMIAIDPATGEGLGISRFVRDAERPRSAEAAVTVIDEWQGRGLGTALLTALTERARVEGIDRFTCLVLAENREMIELLERIGSAREIDRRPGTVELAVDIPPSEEGLGAQLAQVLRTAASGVARFVADTTGGGVGEQSREGCE